MSTRSSASELRKLEIPDLLKEVTEKSSSAMKLRLGLQAGSNKDSSKYRQLKKEIAVLNTVLSEKRKMGMLKTPAKASKVPVPLSTSLETGSVALKRKRRSSSA
jgi:ribosomal protein L29